MPRLPSLVVPLFVAAAGGLVVTRQPVSDSDLFWHLANGRDALAGLDIGIDRYSWTVAGTPADVDQWLGDVLWYLSYALGGWTGIIALRSVTAAAITAIVVATALAAAPRRPFVALVAALPAIVVSRYAWTDRPELFGLLLFALLVALLRADDERALLAIPPLLLLWVNLHGSYALGLGITIFALAERALRMRAARSRYAIIALAAVAATLVTPTRGELRSTSQFWEPPREIAEWSAPDITTMPAFVFALVLLAILLGAMLSSRVGWRDLAILLPVTFVSLTATRHLPFFPIVAAPILASMLAELQARWSGPPPEPLVRGRGAGAMAAVVLGASLVFGIATAPAEPDLVGYPTAALAVLPQGPGVLAQYDWGGYLIWFAPQTPVFIDGRLVPYRPDVLADYRAIVGAHPGWEAVAERRGVRAILVRPTDPIAVRAPDRGWRIAYADDVAVLLVR